MIFVFRVVVGHDWGQLLNVGVKPARCRMSSLVLRNAEAQVTGERWGKLYMSTKNKASLGENHPCLTNRQTFHNSWTGHFSMASITGTRPGGNVVLSVAGAGPVAT